MHVLNCNIMYITVIDLDVSIQFNALLAAGIGPYIHLCAYYMIGVIGEVIRHVDVDYMLTTGKTSPLFWMENHYFVSCFGFNRLFAVSFLRGVKPSRAKVALGKDKQNAYLILMVINFLYLSCPSAMPVVQHGGYG